MENKYFTPDIEDIHAGYECELLIYDKWEPNTIKPYTALASVVRCIKDQIIRVPHLTKEQIEAEGWIACYFKDSVKCHFVKKDFELFIYEDNFISIISKSFNFLYKGECKDINTFRKIIKLLKIN